VIQDAPWDVKAIEVMRIDCVGSVPERKRNGDTPPWHFPITFDGDNAETRIRMVPERPAKEKEPTPEEVKQLWRARSLTEKDIRRSGKYEKRLVHLRRCAKITCPFGAVSSAGGFHSSTRRGIDGA
jgi:hypothetical protein